MKNIYSMSKKELKDYVNNNGWFLNMSLNFLDLDKNKKGTPSEYKDGMPEWATYFEAIASNGDLNRNGYIIRPNAWKSSIPNFLENGVVLYQHDSEKPIGRPLDVKITDKWELRVAWYIHDTNNYSEGNILNGNVTGISTGHITEGVEFEHEETGEVLSEEEFLKEHEYIDFGWFGTYITPNWILAVTKADRLEFSFVTLASNKKSKVKYINGIENYFKNKGVECKIGEDKEMKGNLLKLSLDDMKEMLNNDKFTDKAKEIIQNKINEVEMFMKTNEEDTPIETPVEEIQEDTPIEEVETPTEEVKEEATKSEWCSGDCEDCPADCEDNETSKEENDIEAPKEEETPIEDAKEETPIEEKKPETAEEATNTMKVWSDEVQEQPKEEVPTEAKEENPIEEVTEPDAPEISGWDATILEDGTTQAENNSVEINTKFNEVNALLVEANATIEILNTNNTTLQKEKEELTKQLEDTNKVLEDGTKTIEKLTALVERAKNFSKEQWLNFAWEPKKSLLEQRMKVIG